MEASGQLHASTTLHLGKDLPVHVKQGSGWDPVSLVVVAKRRSLLLLGI